eukprot:bmy_08125T0
MPRALHGAAQAVAYAVYAHSASPFRKRGRDARIMDQVMQFVEPSRQFVKDSIRLVKRCTKPDRKEFQKIAMATAIGFAIMGFIGFFVKLIHIPINNIIVFKMCISVYSFNVYAFATWKVFCREVVAEYLFRKVFFILGLGEQHHIIVPWMR